MESHGTKAKILAWVMLLIKTRKQVEKELNTTACAQGRKARLWRQMRWAKEKCVQRHEMKGWMLGGCKFSCSYFSALGCAASLRLLIDRWETLIPCALHPSYLIFPSHSHSVEDILSIALTFSPACVYAHPLPRHWSSEGECALCLWHPTTEDLSCIMYGGGWKVEVLVIYMQGSYTHWNLNLHYHLEFNHIFACRVKRHKDIITCYLCSVY